MSLLEEPCGPLQGPYNQRRHTLEVVCQVRNAQLHLRWIYTQQLHPTTVERLASAFVNEPTRLLEQCQRGEGMGYALAISSWPSHLRET